MPRKNRDRKRRNRAIQPAPLVHRDENPNASSAARRFAHSIEMLAPFTAMLAITTTEFPTAANVVLNGTGSFVNTGQGDLLITNHHVYDRFLSLRDENPHVKLVMSGAHQTLFVDVSKAKCIGSDKQLDITVLYVPPPLVFKQRKLFYMAETWPPERPEVGMLAVLHGYPGEGRRVEQDGGLGVSALICCDASSFGKQKAFHPRGREPRRIHVRT